MFVGLWSCDETDHWCICKSGCPSRRCSSCWTDRDWSCRDRARCSPAPRSLSSPERDSQPRRHADPAGKQSYMQAKRWSTMSLKLNKQLFRQIQIKLNLNIKLNCSPSRSQTHTRMWSAERTNLYAATEAVLNFPIRLCHTTYAHSLQFGVPQLSIHIHAGLKRNTAVTSWLKATRVSFIIAARI